MAITILRPGQHIAQLGNDSMLITAPRGGAAAVDWSTWFDHFWQAKGAANYAASLLDLVGATNLVEGNGTVPWNIATGWGFITAQSKYFNTTLSPPIAPVTWSIMVQYNNALQIDGYLCGSSGGGTHRLLNLIPHTLGNADKVFYGNGADSNYIWQAPQLPGGNLAIAAKTGYRDGVFDATIPAGDPTGTGNIYIGAYNRAPINAITAEIYAVGIKQATLTAPQVAAAAAAMAAL